MIVFISFEAKLTLNNCMDAVKSNIKVNEIKNEVFVATA
jgi:hypothetical protein